jgi:hypothetical protein
MMDAVSAKEVAAALAVFSSLVEQLGAGGVIGLFVGGPSLMAAIGFAQAAWSGRRMHIIYEEARKNLNELWEKHRSEISQLQEEHRRETAGIVKELGEGLKLATRYYEDNVELVKDYKRLADSLQDLIITNIRSIEKMVASVETLCRATGNK